MNRALALASMGTWLWLASPAVAQTEADDDDQAPLEPAEEEHSLADEGAQQRARIHFQAGASYYEAGAYEDALREWSRAYDLSHRAELLYNFSLAHQGLNHLEQARDYLRQFLDQVTDIPNRANLELRIENLERRIAEQQAAAEPVEPEETEPSDPIETSPPPPQRIPVEGYVSPGAIAGFSIGGAGLVSFAIFGGLTLAEDSRLQTACATPCADGAASDLRTFALVTDISLGLTLAGAAVGVIFLLVDAEAYEEPSVAVTPWADPSGGGVVTRGRF